MIPKFSYRRGYPVATLIGFEASCAAIWQVYSNVVKSETAVKLDGTRSNPKTVYNFHEDIINAIRSTMKEGVKSIILASPPRTNYAKEFLEHVRLHHSWLVQGANRATFADINGSAVTRSDIANLTKNPAFHKLIEDANSAETEDLLGLLEKSLSSSNARDVAFYSLEEVEDLIVFSRAGSTDPQLLLLTDNYLARGRQKWRINRLMQIAANRKIRTRVVAEESPAGKRLNQLGGLVCLARRG